MVGNHYWHSIGFYKGCSVTKVRIMLQGRLCEDPLVDCKTKEEYLECANGALSYAYPIDGASAAALPGSGKKKTASREVAVVETPQQRLM